MAAWRLLWVPRVSNLQLGQTFQLAPDMEWEDQGQEGNKETHDGTLVFKGCIYILLSSVHINTQIMLCDYIFELQVLWCDLYTYRLFIAWVAPV